MGHIETLIFLRLNYILNELINYLSDFLIESPFDIVDIEVNTFTHQFYHNFKLKNDWSLVIFEKYAFRNYQLEILNYHYALLNPQNNIHLSYDNFPHHHHLPTFLHHKHFYPKHRHSPVGFSGEIIDALEEMKWILENM